jgi:ABC-type polysaccharide/polyol phosphate transport system ATPase subunit
VTLLIASHDIALIDQLGCRRIPLVDGSLQTDEDDDVVAEYAEQLESERVRSEWP